MYGVSAVSVGPDVIEFFYLNSYFQVAARTWTTSGWEAISTFGTEAFCTPPVAVSSHGLVAPPGWHAPPGPPGPPGPLPVAKVAMAEGPGPAPAPYRTDVFAIDQTFAMRQMTLVGGAAPGPAEWTNLGGQFRSAPGTIIWNGGRIDLFGVGTDSAMYRTVWDGTAWTGGWERLGGDFSSAVSIVETAPDRIEVFARGADYTLRHRAFTPTGPVTDWQNLGGSLASPPAAISWGPDRLDVFGVGSDGALWHRWWDGELWSDWESLGGTLSSAVSAVSWAPGRLDVFGAAPDGRVVQYTYANGSWISMGIGGTNIDSAPAAIAVASGRFNVVAPGGDGKLYGAEFGSGMLGWAPGAFTEVVTDQAALPARYKFSVDYVFCDNPRSLNSDTDMAQATVKSGDWPAQTTTQNGDNINKGYEWQTNLLNFSPIAVDLCEWAQLSCIVVNSGHAGQASLDSAMTSLGSTIASKAVTALTDLGPAGELAGMVLGFLGPYLFANCDGLVAAEQWIFSGYDLYQKTVGPVGEPPTVYSGVSTYNGSSSPSGCGSNSVYRVFWSVTRA